MILVQHADRISPRSDATATGELTAALREEGIEIRTGAKLSRVRREGVEVVATIDNEDVSVAQVLLASGRLLNVEQLELDRVGIEHSRAGIIVDDPLRTSVDGVWAAGDVTGAHQFTPGAQYEARVAVENMFGGNGARADYELLPTVIFTDPELAAVGITEEEARSSGIDYEVAVHPIKYVQRPSYTGTKRGLYKLLWDRESRRVLSIQRGQPDAGDVVQGFGVAMKLGATVAEGIKAAAENASPARMQVAGPA